MGLSLLRPSFVPSNNNLMIMQSIPSFYIIGIAVRTTNENGQSSIDIPALWERFMAEGIAEKIPGKTGSDIYCLYTAYEKDHTLPYTTVLGCRVNSLNSIPQGMAGLAVEEGAYEKFVATGDLAKGAVYGEWLKIWEADIPRAFKTDFEVYGAKAQQAGNAEVDIFIGIKS